MRGELNGFFTIKDGEVLTQEALKKWGETLDYH